LRVRVLVACEFSGTVRSAFSDLGHDAWSCDLLPTEVPGQHYRCDVREVLDRGWDLMVAHPPCTHLAVSGARWFGAKLAQPSLPLGYDDRDPQAQALEFVEILMAAPIDRIAVENPVSIISSRIRKPDQVVQPWQFGDGETKATCLWLKNLPALVPTDVVSGRSNRIHMMRPGPSRWRERSRTYSGIAAAMAMQWGGPIRAAATR
jgi:site-specific DNA-cytosine methylase